MRLFKFKIGWLLAGIYILFTIFIFTGISCPFSYERSPWCSFNAWILISPWFQIFGFVFDLDKNTVLGVEDFFYYGFLSFFLNIVVVYLLGVLIQKVYLKLKRSF